MLFSHSLFGLWSGTIVICPTKVRPTSDQHPSNMNWDYSKYNNLYATGAEFDGIVDRWLAWEFSSVTI